MATDEKNSGELNAKQLRAIDALLREPKTEAAAKATGVSVTTLWRWLNEPVFSTAYRAARGKVLENTLAALQSASGDAVATLRKVLADEFAKPGEKVSAARAILEFSLKAREVMEVEQRLTDLEKRLTAQDAPPKGQVSQWR